MPEPGIQTKPTCSCARGPSCGDIGKVEEPMQTKTVAQQITPLVQGQDDELEDEEGEIESVPTASEEEQEKEPEEEGSAPHYCPLNKGEHYDHLKRHF